MKSLVETLQHNSIICKKLSSLPPRELGSRKQVKLYIGVGLDGYYCSVMVLAKKSRVLSKEAETLMQLHGRMETYIDAAIKKRYMWVKAPLCSKAKEAMETAGWTFL
jgi:hypothetical protein